MDHFPDPKATEHRDGPHTQLRFFSNLKQVQQTQKAKLQ